MTATMKRELLMCTQACPLMKEAYILSNLMDFTLYLLSTHTLSNTHVSRLQAHVASASTYGVRRLSTSLDSRIKNQIHFTFIDVEIFGPNQIEKNQNA